MDHGQHSPGVLKDDPFSLNPGREILKLLLLGAALGCLCELLHFALPGGSPGVGGWAFLYRATRGAVGLTLGTIICLRLVRDRQHASSGILAGGLLPQIVGQPSPAFGWPEWLGSALFGLFTGCVAGLVGAIFASLVPDYTAKAKVAPDPLDDGL